MCDEIIHRCDSSETSEILKKVLSAYLNKMVLLIEIDRYGDAVSVCDEFVNRFGIRRDPVSLSYLAMALFGKGSALYMSGDAPNALQAYDQALIYYNAVGIQRTEGHSYFVANTILHKGRAFIQNNQARDALDAFDELATRFCGTDNRSVSGLVATAIIWKVILSSGMNRTVSENEFATLLEHLPATNFLPEGCVSLLIQFCVAAGPVRALEMIQASPSSYPLLPLVTALEQILGRSPRVAREVEEIAAELRQELEEKMALTRH